MNPRDRIVTRTPLSELWSDGGPLKAARVAALGRADLVALLRDRAVHFVVADPGRQLQWIPKAECFGFWKHEVRDHLVDDPALAFRLEQFPGEYAYVASRWTAVEDPETPIVLLERQH